MSALAVYEQDLAPAVLIGQVKRFLKNSFPDIDYDNISVVLSKRSALQHTQPLAASGPEVGFSNLALVGWILGPLLLLSAAGLICWFRVPALRRLVNKAQGAANDPAEADNGTKAGKAEAANE